MRQHIAVSSERWLLSTLIAIHLVAISAASLPDPRELDLVRPAAAVSPVDRIADIATPALNATIAALTPLEAHAYRFTAPIRALTGIYIEAGLRQKWNMFANPVTADQYVRVAHYVRSSREPGRVQVFRELALPGQPEERVRLVHMFRDKAILNSSEAFAVNRLKDAGADRVSDLDPIAAYFSNRFRAAYLAPDETITQTEIWFGAAPMPANGERLTDSQLEERWAALQRYRDGPVDAPVPVAPLQPGAVQGESDIVWRLEYVQKR
jgi:hypothetical protein